MKNNQYDKFAFIWGATKLEDTEDFKSLTPEEKTTLINVLEKFIVFYNEGLIAKDLQSLGINKTQ